MSEIEDLYGSAIELARAFDQNFVDLAVKLHQLQELSPERYSDFVKQSGVGTRKAYYLIAISKTFVRALKVPKHRLIALGWTKLMALDQYVTKKNYKELMEFAMEHTVAGLLPAAMHAPLKAYLNDGDPSKNARSVLMYFSPADYNLFVDTLIKHGAVRDGRALRDKEKALMRLVERAAKEK